MLYVNAYVVTRHYGGPEEGGWWYDVGVPAASVPVPDDTAACVEIKRLETQLSDLNEGDINGVNGGQEVQVYKEDAVAQYWPEELPSYE